MTWLMIPKPGRIMIYTSGCPKNQNKCWNRTGSPPPSGLKKEVPKLRSVNSIVIAPPKTGKESNNKNEVINIAQPNKGILWMVIPGARMFRIVVMKFTAPRIDDAPARWRAKIAISTEASGCPAILESGG